MNFLRNLPIKRKLMVIIMVVSGVATWVVSLSFITYQQVAYRRQMVQDLSILAAVTGANSTAGLSFNEAGSVGEALKSLSAQPGIVHACIYDKDGRPFARYQRAQVTGEFRPPSVRGDGSQFGQNRLELFRRINLAGETIGTIYLEMDLHEMNMRIWRYVLIMLLVLLAAGVVAFFLSAWLQAYISKPLSDLASTVTIITANKDYSVRAVKSGEDELGRLIDGFNEMLAQIQERDANLERRVKERTRELAHSLSLTRATLESTTDGILVTDGGGKVTNFNEQFIALWRIPRELAETKDEQQWLAVAFRQLKDSEQFARGVKELYEHPERESFDVLECNDGRVLERSSKPQRMGENIVGRVWSFRDVTERARIQREIAESRNFLDRIINSISDPIFVKDRQHRGVLVNDAFCSLMARRREELIGKSDHDHDCFSGAEANGFRSKDELVFETGKENVNEEKFTAADGTVHCIITKKSLYTDEKDEKFIVGVIRDITERQRAEAELAYERDLLRALLDNSPDHIYFKDAQSRFIKTSQSQARQFGAAAADEMVGRSDFDFFTEEHARPAFEDEQNIIRTGQPMIGRIEKESWKDGRGESWVLTTKMPLRDKTGQVIGTFGISKNITAIKEAEARLEEVHRQLVDASRQAGMAEVATSVLHNVGNVLNSVNVSTILILDTLRKSKLGNVGRLAVMIQEHKDNLAAFFTTDPKGREFPNFFARLAEHLTEEQAGLLKEVELTRNNVEHIKDIVAMQQNYAKISGVVETVKVVDLVEDALRMNGGALARHDVQVTRDFPAETIEINVERQKVLQVLVNLIRNAKYACDDAGRKDKRLTMQVRGANGRVQIAVKDNGVGIPAENMTRIFNHGFTTREKGHGFGLHGGALAAKEMGGTLSVHSNGPGQGATFILELPLQPESASDSDLNSSEDQ